MVLFNIKISTNRHIHNLKHIYWDIFPLKLSRLHPEVVLGPDPLLTDPPGDEVGGGDVKRRVPHLPGPLDGPAPRVS